MEDWFTIDKIDERTFVISEYRHPEETHCYLLVGSKRSLLIDTGLGICNISEQVYKLTDKPVTAIATHIHWDHIGGLGYFPDFYVHKNELNWVRGNFPLPIEAVRKMMAEGCNLPKNFDIGAYTVFCGNPTVVLEGGEIIDIGGRKIEVVHTPGHSPGHLCFWEKERGYLFSGDLIYKGTLFANYLSTDPIAYLDSLEKVAALPLKRLFPAHHSLEIEPEIAIRMRNEFRKLNACGKLHHGAGRFCYGDWQLLL